MASATETVVSTSFDDPSITVNLEIFARVLFSRNFAYAKFRENKSSRNGEISPSSTDVGKAFPGREF